MTHVISCNEGTALTTAIGWHRGVSDVPVVYLQCKTLVFGNMINPLMSLCHGDAFVIRPSSSSQNVVRSNSQSVRDLFEFLQRVVERRDAKFRRTAFDASDTIDEQGRQCLLACV